MRLMEWVVNQSLPKLVTALELLTMYNILYIFAFHCMVIFVGFYLEKQQSLVWTPFVAHRELQTY